MTAGPTRDSFQPALDRIVHRSLFAVFAGLAILHAVLSLLDYVLPPDLWQWSSQGVWSAISALFLLGMCLLLRRFPVPDSWAHPLATLVAVVMLAKVLDHVWHRGPETTSYDPTLFVVGVGCFLLSRWWHAIVCGTVVLAWLGVSLAIDPAATAHSHVLFPLLTGVTLSILVHEVRLRTYRNYEQNQQQLELVSGRLQQIMDYSPAVIFIKNLSGEYTFVNRRFEQLFDVRNDDLRKIGPAGLFPEKTVSQLEANDRQMFAAREAVTLEEVIPQKDGDHTYLVVKFPIWDAHGKPLALCGIATDISDRKRAQMKLARSEARFRSVFESDAIGLIIGTFDGSIDIANDAFLKMSGYERSELPLRWDRMTPEEFLGRDQAAIEEMKQTGTCRPYEKEYFRKDGTRLPILLVAGTLDPDGKDVSAFVLDLTERKRAEEKVREMTAQLDQVSRLGNLGEMAAKIAHELHQPLTAIYNYSRGAVRMIEAERLGLQEARALFEDLATQSMHAGQVVERVRSHVGKREPQFEPIELDSVIDDALILVRIAIREPDVELVVTRGSGVPRVRGDKIQLSQVVINLALNAVQALADVTDRPRRLTIETRACNDGGAEIVVADNGPGLAPIVRERLFRQFVTTKPMGLGLGLAMCKSIVELHGGELIARDPAGGGCAFHAVLPPLEPASDAEEDSASGGISGWSDDASVPENGGEFAEPEPLSDNAV